MRFRPDNKIRYGQDSQQHVGVPSGVDFTVEKFGSDLSGMFVLVGDGYGQIKPRGHYGNGALYAWGLTPKQARRFRAEIKGEKS